MKLSAILAGKTSAVITIAPDASVNDLVELLAVHRIGAVIVSDNGSDIAGIVSERDVVRALVGDSQILKRTVSSIMTTEVHTAGADSTIDDLMLIMTNRRIRHVPVVDDSGLIGIVSIGDVVKHRIDELEGDRAALVDYITRGG